MAFLKFRPTASAYTAAVHIRADAIISVDEHADGRGGRVQTAAGAYDVTESPAAILAAIADASGGAVDEVTVTDAMAAAGAEALIAQRYDWMLDTKPPTTFDIVRAVVLAALRARRQP